MPIMLPFKSNTFMYKMNLQINDFMKYAKKNTLLINKNFGLIFFPDVSILRHIFGVITLIL